MKNLLTFAIMALTLTSTGVFAADKIKEESTVVVLSEQEKNEVERVKATLATYHIPQSFIDRTLEQAANKRMVHVIYTPSSDGSGENMVVTSR